MPYLTHFGLLKMKRKSFKCSLAGSYFGPVLAPIITIAIVNAFNWQAVFYIFGAVGIVMAILWAIIAKDLPEHHKMVSEAEKKYIIEHRDIVATEKSLPPWKRFLSHFSFMHCTTIFCSTIRYRIILNLVTNIFG